MMYRYRIITILSYVITIPAMWRRMLLLKNKQSMNNFVNVNNLLGNTIIEGMRE